MKIKIERIDEEPMTCWMVWADGVRVSAAWTFRKAVNVAKKLCPGSTISDYELDPIDK